MRAGEALDAAKALVDGPRQDEYGPIEESMQDIADAWSWWLRARFRKFGLTPKLAASDAAEMLSLMKKARKAAGAPTDDSYIDDLGYSAIAAQVRE